MVGDNLDNAKVTLSYKVQLGTTLYDGIAIDLYVTTKTNSMPSYYDGVNLNLTGTRLKSILRSLISNTKKTTSYDDLKTILNNSDRDLNNSNNIILFYLRTSKPGAYSYGYWNREHVWPKSQGWFSTSGAGSDAHHIRPTNATTNSTRSNNPYGVVSHTSSSIKKLDGVTYGYLSGGVFEPLDEVKGDVARIILYLLVRYSESDSYPITNVISSYKLLLEWNELDPVDDLERNRNEVVYSVQGNRNPFIDDSTLANKIYNENGIISKSRIKRTFVIPFIGEVEINL